MNNPVVRYERLRPSEIVARREACPVAYLPIGTIEWHGVHNPVGLDAVKMQALLERCAQKIGGLVFPALFYGENREQALMDATAADRHDIHTAMQLPDENFVAGYMGESILEQNQNYLRLLTHIFQQIKSLGFRVLVVGAGHYPLIDHARAAAAFFHQTQVKPRMITWAMSGYELVRDQFKESGDHGGFWETSLLMALDPGMQDLSLLPPENGPVPVGISNNGVQRADAAFGEKAVSAIINVVEMRVREFLDQPGRYQGHGSPM